MRKRNQNRVKHSVLELGFSAAQPSVGADASANPGPPALLDRVAFEKRGALVSLSMEDHYVRVRTTQGDDLVLMRLSDAIKETAPVQGLQTHRSHWVALDFLTACTRSGAGAVLTMHHGPDIPVSRSQIDQAKAKGLLKQ